MARKKAIEMLYVGNSFTVRNDLPTMVAELAAVGSGIKIEHQLISASGASLRRHWNRGAARQVIEKAKLDYVVLQEQSTLPVKNARRFHENVREFVPLVRDSGATLVLYMTWARKNVPQTQASLTNAYLEIGKEVGATVVPAGMAWQAFLEKHSEPLLHDKDNSHPTLAGSYLAACCFYATLFDGDPRAVDMPSIKQSPGDKKKLASVAQSIAG